MHVAFSTSPSFNHKLTIIMKRIFLVFAAVLLIISACKKDSNVDAAKQLLKGTWNQVNFTTKVVDPSKNVKFLDGDKMQSTIYANYDKYEVTAGRLKIIKSSDNSSITNTFSVSSDSLYIEPSTACTDANGCALLFAKQK